MRPLLLLFALALGTATAVAQEAAQDVPLEYRVKAAYLYNFVKFVEWPDPARSGPINICVAGRNPFGTVLADTIRGEVVQGRPLTARIILEPEAGCQVLFIPQGSPAGAYLRPLRATPTLTVGESEGFLQEGGIIAFVHDNNNIRFAINADAAAQAMLQVSSRLLRLAVNTRGVR